jgi:hypothetical protein
MFIKIVIVRTKYSAVFVFVLLGWLTVDQRQKNALLPLSYISMLFYASDSMTI